MKRYIIGAAAMLLSTSALAATLTDDMGSKEPKNISKWESVDKSWSAAGTAAADDMPLADKTAMPLAESEVYGGISDPKPELASASWDEGIDPDPAMTSADSAAMPTPVGGPVETAAVSDLTPRPASQNYPACEPGPGDDSCIQLYEPGVRTALASWDQSLGGLDQGQTATAMGGPYEPVIADHATEMAAISADETMPDAAYAANEVDPMIAESASHQGVGGPLAETGYPPCTGSAGEDRCIQLYERGVTGEGN